MKIKYKAPLIILGVTLSLTAISGYMNYSSNIDLINKAMQHEMSAVSIEIQNDIKDQSGIAASLASLVVNMDAVQQDLRARDREALTKAVLPAFLIQKDKFGVADAHFHVPPLTSFLRLYDLTHYGDDLSSSREILLAANKQQRPLQGVEISRTGVSIKGVDIVKDSKGSIGSFEVGVSFSRIIDDIKRYTGFEAAIFVQDDLMTKLATDSVRNPDLIIGGYRKVSSSDWEKVRPLISADLLAKVDDVTYKVQSFNGVDYGTVLVPLLDFKGVQIGSIVAIGDFQQYQNRLEASLVNSITFVLLQSIIFIGTILIVFSVFLIGPINHINDKLKELIAGAPDIELGSIVHTEDEVGLLARNVDKLKKMLMEKQKKPENSKSPANSDHKTV